MTEWISVKDALPTHTGKILVVINGQILQGEAVEQCASILFIDKEVYFEMTYVYEQLEGDEYTYVLHKKSTGGRWIKNVLYAEVSHWMPLPEVPK